MLAWIIFIIRCRSAVFLNLYKYAESLFCSRTILRPPLLHFSSIKMRSSEIVGPVKLKGTHKCRDTPVENHCYSVCVKASNFLTKQFDLLYNNNLLYDIMY